MVLVLRAADEGRNASAKRDGRIDQLQAERASASPSERGGPESGEARSSGSMSVRYSKVTSGDGSRQVSFVVRPPCVSVLTLAGYICRIAFPRHVPFRL